MPYIHTEYNPQPIETDISCDGCGADLLVVVDWEEKEFDEELGCPIYDMVFVSVSCSINPDYGCICVNEGNTEFSTRYLQPDYLLEKVIDYWYAREEKRMEALHG